jgi:5S rRNA maturation endonuclease (ribonuclease M5)
MPTRIPIRKPRPESDYVNCTALLEEWSMFTDMCGLQDLANKLGVSALALRCLGVVWSGEHWAFPMRDKHGDVCGIQLRYQDGFKQTLRGSRVGYFIPDMPATTTAIVCEGASDTAAAMSLGFYAIGRYNCAQSGYDLGQYLRRQGVRDVVICADSDAPGIAGAEKLCGELRMHCCIYTPPAKDLRCSLEAGITRSLIESSVSSLVWRNA